MKKLLPILLLFFSVAVFSQEKVPTNKELKDRIERLTSELKEIKESHVLEIQKNEERERDLYKEYSGITKELVEDIRDRVTSCSWWVSILITLVSGVVGVLIPILITLESKKEVDARNSELKADIQSKIVVIEKIKEDSIDAINEINGIKEIIKKQATRINELKEKIENSEKETELFAIQAEVSKLFSEALNETDQNLKLELYTKAIELIPESGKSYNNRGVIYDKMNDYDNAMLDYNKAIELNPESDKAYMNRGVLYTKMNDYDNAMLDYNKAIELIPDIAEMYNNRAILYRKLAEKETDPNKKDEFIKLGEADKKKYKELTDGKE